MEKNVLDEQHGGGQPPWFVHLCGLYIMKVIK
jgi:hypothetical protein